MILLHHPKHYNNVLSLLGATVELTRVCPCREGHVFGDVYDQIEDSKSQPQACLFDERTDEAKSKIIKNKLKIKQCNKNN